jgi:hypothetical protein
VGNCFAQLPGLTVVNCCIGYFAAPLFFIFYVGAIIEASEAMSAHLCESFFDGRIEVPQYGEKFELA